MANISALNGITCTNISAIDGIAFANIAQFDDNTFCPVVSPSPTPTNTPTPTITPTPTPTPVPCDPGCCEKELCFGRDCGDACSCNQSEIYYLHQPCNQDPCELAYADGIFTEETCTDPAKSGYYTDGLGDCWYWDGVSSLTNQGGC